jgi:hypothetical protein
MPPSPAYPDGTDIRRLLGDIKDRSEDDDDGHAN